MADHEAEAVRGMAMEIPEKFEGTLGCGHTGSVSLAGVPLDKRFARIAYLQDKGRCSACFGKANEKARAAENAASVRWSVEQGLPPLRGSIKQAAFGELVRRNLMVEAHRLLVEDGDWSEEQFTQEVQEPAELIGSARWWIDQKEALPLVLPDLLRESPDVRAREWERAVGAAPIVGSEAQVGWARRLRFEKVEEARRSMVPERMSAEDFESIEGQASRVNSARWWIDQEPAPCELLPALLSAAGHDAFIENTEL